MQFSVCPNALFSCGGSQATNQTPKCISHEQDKLKCHQPLALDRNLAQSPYSEVDNPHTIGIFHSFWTQLLDCKPTDLKPVPPNLGRSNFESNLSEFLS